jgi:2,3-bisphosphoglycerate-dependent phosphoglycerate mutase
MYGDLVGRNKKEAVLKFGEQSIRYWRRSYDVPPPPIDKSNHLWPGHDPKYASLEPSQIPQTECLKDTLLRAFPYWESTMLPEIMQGKTILFVGHANVMRALLKYLDAISDDTIMSLNIPRAVPLLYEFEANGEVLPSVNASAPLRGRYMADDATLKRLLEFEEAQIKV